VAADEAHGLVGGGGLAVEEALVEGGEEGEEGEGDGGAGEGEEGAAAVAQDVSEDEGAESEHFPKEPSVTNDLEYPDCGKLMLRR
jgi:hypothetical protein